nr:lysophospholipase [Gammaproteobacteria bacterium]
GFIVGSHDHPGHGLSQGKRGVINPPGALVTQAAVQIHEFALETGRTPVVFGHSLGGVVATELVITHRMSVAGLVLSAPAFAPYISWGNRVKLKLLTHLAPQFAQELPYDASRLTHDKEEQAKAEQDPLNHGFKSASLVSWLVESGQRSIEDAQQLDVKTLLLIAGDDPVVDSGQTERFGQQVRSELLTTCRYQDYRHEILNETPERRSRVVADIVQWMQDFT